MARVESNRYRYLSSLADELHSQSRRVRDLIGDAHWYYDGHHKEYLLSGVLRRHAPSGILVSRGFVVSPSVAEHRSTEQDILVIDTLQEAPIFQQSDVTVAFPQSVLAAISVKTKMDSATVSDAINGLNTVRTVATACAEDGHRLWCGAYFFEVGDSVLKNPTAPYEYIGNALRDYPASRPVLDPTQSSPMGPQLLCTAHAHAYRITYETAANASISAQVSGFHAGETATAIFLTHLFDHIAWCRGRTVSGFSEFVEQVEVPAMTPATTLIGLGTSQGVNAAVAPPNANRT